MALVAAMQPLVALVLVEIRESWHSLGMLGPSEPQPDPLSHSSFGLAAHSKNVGKYDDSNIPKYSYIIGLGLHSGIDFLKKVPS